MNVLLDLVVCGPGARLCGGITQLISNDSDGVCNDPKFWNAFTRNESPPIPKVVEISKSSESDDDDSVSLLSELEVSKAYSRYQEALTLQKNGRVPAGNKDPHHDLYLDEVIQGPRDTDSLAVSSFDSRMGDTRFMEMEDDGGDCDEWDDGSSYSSFYFRLRPKSHEQVASHSWQTTSTRTTRSVRNPSHFHTYD